MVAEGERVYPPLGQGTGDGPGQAGAGRRIFGIGNDEIEPPLPPERRHPREHKVATGPADNITDEQESNHASKSA